MYRSHYLLHAVTKLAREVRALGREGVLLWFKGKGSEMGNTCMQKFVTSVRRSWDVRLKTQNCTTGVVRADSKTTLAYFNGP